MKPQPPPQPPPQTAPEQLPLTAQPAPITENETAAAPAAPPTKDKVMTKAESRYRKYTRIERRKVRATIRKLVADGAHTYDALLAGLKAAGIRAPGGGPMERNQLAGQLASAGIRLRTKRRTGVRPRFPAEPAAAAAASGTDSGADDTTTLIDLVLDANLSDAKKLAMIRGLRSGGCGGAQ